MSVEHITAAFKHSKAKLAPKFVLVCLSNFASADGICFPSIKKISEYCGMCERAVHNAIDQLIELKELEIVERGGTINGKKLANVYRVILPVDGCMRCTGAPDARVHLVPKDRCTRCRATLRKNRQKEPSTTRQPPAWLARLSPSRSRLLLFLLWKGVLKKSHGALSNSRPN